MPFIVDTNVFLTAANLDLGEKGGSFEPEDVVNCQNCILMALTNGGIVLNQNQAEELKDLRDKALRKGIKIVGTEHQSINTVINQFNKAPSLQSSPQELSRLHVKQKKEFLKFYEAAPDVIKKKKANRDNAEDLTNVGKSLKTDDGLIVDWVLLETARRREAHIITDDLDLDYLAQYGSERDDYVPNVIPGRISNPNRPSKKRERPKLAQGDFVPELRNSKTEKDLWTR